MPAWIASEESSIEDKALANNGNTSRKNERLVASNRTGAMSRYANRHPGLPIVGFLIILIFGVAFSHGYVVLQHPLVRYTLGLTTAARVVSCLINEIKQLARKRDRLETFYTGVIRGSKFARKYSWLIKISINYFSVKIAIEKWIKFLPPCWISLSFESSTLLAISPLSNRPRRVWHAKNGTTAYLPVKLFADNLGYKRTARRTG